ncbi:uncharacterized protein PGTG_11591 [Puccinia graminis f. sp. tritici CRL 75-36-700-3]|uniref:Uncharacterized protein n=1 Tax=Puccinia graminis f. sp. tritici (strain CRL 75-36-700-3 / race SCCL) TaxID=418459 RepID=E3KNG0_PUCGT|nr:uncharacterized protein PGTG_11591 [Puccinia graminis f. sp. tritici CRL 75-36-700-3]EFP85835.2 hypothetical protein PGTG_11591 [Puccinia graminis f. sp. tritici CRL 75-36-700-3]
MSLAQISSIHGLPDNTIHLTSVISSPDIAQHTPQHELSKFHIILQSYSPEPPSWIYEPLTEIFFTGHLGASTVGSYPRIVVGAGKWVLHRGQHFELVEQFHKAGVWGSGYVVSANYNRTSPLRSYLTVFDPSPKQGGRIQLLAWDSDIVKKMSCLKRGDWITSGGKAGIDSFKDTHIVESTVSRLELLGRSESTRYYLRSDPKKIHQLTVDDWAPEKLWKKRGRKIRLSKSIWKKY